MILRERIADIISVTYFSPHEGDKWEEIDDKVIDQILSAVADWIEAELPKEYTGHPHNRCHNGSWKEAGWDDCLTEVRSKVLEPLRKRV